MSVANPAGNGSVMTGIGKASPRASLTTSSGSQAVYSTPNQPFEDVLLRQRNLGQDIIPSPREPKRTESLYTPQKPMVSGGTAAPSPGGGGGFFGKSGKLKVHIQLPLSNFSFLVYLLFVCSFFSVCISFRL